MTATEGHSVLVVDDHPLLRQGVVAAITRAPDFNVLGEADSIARALELARRFRPEIVLLDVALPDGSGVEAVPLIHQITPDARIIMLTVDDDSQTIVEAFKAGAAGYLLKGTSASELLSAIRAIARGDAYTTPHVASALLSEVIHPHHMAGNDLTTREQTVFELVGDGLTNREIAQRLVLSEKTVKRHVTVIMQKLGVRNRVEVAIHATRLRSHHR